jgi:hypothetical protein
MPETVAVKETEINKGRPELYPTLVKPYFDDIYNWIAEGNTEESIAKKLGIHPYTWICYKKGYTELTELITRARQSAGELMLHKQYQKASGMTISLNKQKVTKDGDVVDITEEMYIPPDTNAADFWARHLYPDYKPAKGVENGNLTINNFQLPEIDAKIQKLLKELNSLETQSAVDVECIEVKADYTK